MKIEQNRSVRIYWDKKTNLDKMARLCLYVEETISLYNNVKVEKKKILSCGK